MRILCCYTPGQLRDETRAALKAHALHRADLCFVKIDPLDPYAYGRRLLEEWHRQRTFAIVEPDIVVREDVIDAFQSCDCMYGGFPYAWKTDVGIALGCTRFRSAFIRQFPNAMDEALASRCTWTQLDVTFQRAILVRRHGQQPHICGPEVVHLNEEKALMEGRSREPLATLPDW